MKNIDSSSISIDGDNNIIARGNIFITKHIVYPEAPEAACNSHGSSCTSKNSLKDFSRSFILLDKSIKDDEYFERRLRQYEQQVSQGGSPYSVLFDLLDDIDHWRKDYSSEYYALIHQYIARLMIMCSVTNKSIHNSAQIVFEESREFLEKSLKNMSYSNQLESYWLYVLTFREQKNTNMTIQQLETIISGTSQKLETSYRLFAARELAMIQYETGSSNQEVRQTLHMIKNNLHQLMVRSESYSCINYEHVEKIITIWAYLDLSLKIGDISTADDLIQCLDNRGALSNLFPKLHKVILSDFYRTLYMYYSLKGNTKVSQCYLYKHSILCEEHQLENSLVWMDNIKKKLHAMF